MGQYGADNFFVKDANGNDVAAKYLKDANGNYIIDGSTGRPYVVPADFNLDAVIAKYKVDVQMLIDPETSIGVRLGSYVKLFSNFQTNCPDDLQTSYNGMVGASRVKDFQAGANYVFGVACGAGGLTLPECEAGGGFYNYWKSLFPKTYGYINASGAFGNNPANIQDIEQGYRSQINPTTPELSQIDVKFISFGNTAVVTENGNSSVYQYKAVTENSVTVWKYVPVEGGSIDAAINTGVYTVQSGNVLGDIAIKFGTTVQKIMEANPDITDPDLIYAGQQIILPKDNLFSLTNTPDLDPTQQGATDQSDILAQLYQNILYDDGITQIVSNVGDDVNTNTGAAALANYNQSGDYRPGNNSTFDENSIPDYVMNYSLYDDLMAAAQANTASTWLTYNLAPTDPLVLDLNGDGVKLTDYGNAGVLFDADHDGGSLEQTGWVSPEDGLVVYDANLNGRIDDISETLSEYFGGAVGTGGSAGEKPYRDGFEALASLDSNHDNVFDSSDTAWNNVKVWVDTNHDGKSWVDTNGNGVFDSCAMAVGSSRGL